MTQQQLAAVVVEQSVSDKLRPVQRWESGGTCPRQDVLERYVEVLERLAFLEDDAAFTLAELVFQIVDEGTDFAAWSARLARAFVPPAVLRLPAAMRVSATMERQPDGGIALVYDANPRHRISPTHQRIVFKGPQGQRVRIRVERDGSVSAELPAGWVCEQIGPHKLDEEAQK